MKIKIKEKLKQRVTSWYIAVRKIFLDQWTKISEENREKFFSFLSVTLNFLLNALLLSVPVTLLLPISYWKSVICIWFSLPFIEHYYVWFRENWRDSLVK